jgi:hypothetical protein
MCGAGDLSRALHMLGRHSTTELHTQIFLKFWDKFSQIYSPWTGTCYVAQDGFEFVVLLPQPPE